MPLPGTDHIVQAEAPGPYQGIAVVQGPISPTEVQRQGAVPIEVPCPGAVPTVATVADLA
jgi:hypothetical protein